MIIFDLDGTLADCEHRRHFVDPTSHKRYMIDENGGNGEVLPAGSYSVHDKKFRPRWKEFFEACDGDNIIVPTRYIMESLHYQDYRDLHIWSGRCESVREKTEKWLLKHIPRKWYKELKMRPIGDSTPDDVLKEFWLDEFLISQPLGYSYITHPIKMVFDDRPKVVRMWRRRGIFVFDCNQKGNEF